jgi:hypothetical protein
LTVIGQKNTDNHGNNSKETSNVRKHIVEFPEASIDVDLIVAFPKVNVAQGGPTGNIVPLFVIIFVHNDSLLDLYVIPWPKCLIG